MQYGIVGAGAVGKALGAALAWNGSPPLFIAREGGSPPGNARRQFRVLFPDGSDYSWTSPVVSPSALNRHSVPGILLVTVRSHQVGAALSGILPLLAHARLVVFLQGGIQFAAARDRRLDRPGLNAAIDIGHCFDILDAAGSRADVACGLTGLGACAPDADTAILSGPGKLTLGGTGMFTAHDLLQRALEDLSAPWVAPSLSGDIVAEMFQKACGTLGMNAASLIWQCPLGNLVSKEDAFSIMCELAEYAAAAYRKLGFPCMQRFDAYFRDVARRMPRHTMAILGDRREIYATMSVQALIAASVLGIDPPHIGRLPLMRDFMRPERNTDLFLRQAQA